MRGETALGVPGRLEPLHPALALTGGLVGIFGTIVQVTVLPMCHARHGLPLGGLIASQFIGHDDPREIHQALKELSEELLRGSPVAPRLDQNIEDVTLLLHRPPEMR
jgi:hypothetical protein